VIFLKQRKKLKLKTYDKVKNLIANQYSKSDPEGSYTGIPNHFSERPVQDADDL